MGKSLIRSFIGNTKGGAIFTLILLLFLLTAVRISRAQPGVQTLSASNITDTSATLNGIVSPNGMETHWNFNYGRVEGNAFLGYCPDTGPGVLLGPGQAITSETVTVTCQLSGLEPSTTYYFFLGAQWVGDAWQYGEQLSFTTSATQSYTMASIYTNILTIIKTSATSATSQPLGPGFDFAMSISPASASVIPGSSAQYAVGVTYSNPSFAGTVINVQLTGLGPGMNYDLSQNGALTITTSPTTPTGAYPFTITGSASGVTHQIGGTLIVTQSNSVSTTPVTMTSPPTTTTERQVSTATSVVTQTATVEPSQTTTETSTSKTETTSDIIGLLQHNSLLIIAILLIALTAVLLSGRRRSRGSAPQIQPQNVNVTYCSHCGTQNPATNSFCRKCGTKLLSASN